MCGMTRAMGLLANTADPCVFAMCRATQVDTYRFMSGLSTLTLVNFSLNACLPYINELMSHPCPEQVKNLCASWVPPRASRLSKSLMDVQILEREKGFWTADIRARSDTTCAVSYLHPIFFPYIDLPIKFISPRGCVATSMHRCFHILLRIHCPKKLAFTIQ